jgi:dihydrodipicolinate reductase
MGVATNIDMGEIHHNVKTDALSDTIEHDAPTQPF